MRNDPTFSRVMCKSAEVFRLETQSVYEVCTPMYPYVEERTKNEISVLI